MEEQTNNKNYGDTINVIRRVKRAIEVVYIFFALLTLHLFGIDGSAVLIQYVILALILPLFAINVITRDSHGVLNNFAINVTVVTILNYNKDYSVPGFDGIPVLPATILASAILSCICWIAIWLACGRPKPKLGSLHVRILRGLVLVPGLIWAWATCCLFVLATALVSARAYMTYGSQSWIGSLLIAAFFVAAAVSVCAPLAWYYREGRLKAPKILRRKEKCWCGSMKNYKRCHEK